MEAMFSEEVELETVPGKHFYYKDQQTNVFQFTDFTVQVKFDCIMKMFQEYGYDLKNITDTEVQSALNKIAKVLHDVRGEVIIDSLYIYTHAKP
jgi:hypothetical protein